MILEKIINNRKRLLVKEKDRIPEPDLRKNVHNLIESGYKPHHFLQLHVMNKSFLIAEIKKASPSRGIIRENFSVEEIADIYGKSAKVNAISVLTEPDFFMGKYEYLNKAKKTGGKPVLMKDFIIDDYQIYTGFLEGASAILLIASVLSDSDVKKLADTASKLSLSVLFETHNAEEYKRALDLGMKIIGINNRDLKTFVTDIKTTADILKSENKPMEGIVISESGINSKKDVEFLLENGADGFLVGERFMKEKDISKSIAEVFGR